MHGERNVTDETKLWGRNMLNKALKINENNEVVSLVGAGGKTSFMYALARELSSLQRKVIITTTTHLKKPIGKNCELMILENCPERAAHKINQKFNISNVALWAHKELPQGKISGILPENLEIIANKGIADYILVEADGSKGLPIKAPAPHEPVIPKKTTMLVGVIGIDALGRTIDNETVHRPEILSSIAQRPLGEVIDEKVIQNLINSHDGLFKGSTDRMKKVVVINKVDDDQRLELALKLAKGIKNKSSIEIFRILLTSFNFETPGSG